jgi:hypothetical protein
MIQNTKDLPESESARERSVQFTNFQAVWNQPGVHNFKLKPAPIPGLGPGVWLTSLPISQYMVTTIVNAK